MSEYTEIFGRRIKDLTTPNSELDKTSEPVGNIKIPAGNFPTELSGCEGLRLIDLKNYLFTPLDPEFVADFNLLKETVDTNNVTLTAAINTEVERAKAKEDLIAQQVVINREEAVSKLDEVNLDLQTQINALGAGNLAYKTYDAMFLDKLNIPAKSKVTVTNDPTQSNNGDWQWDGATFTKSSYDPVSISTNYVNSNPNFKAGSIGAGVDLRTLTTSGTYYKVGSTNITPDLNYPAPLAGKLRVDTITSGVTIHEYTVASTAETFKCFLLNGVWSAWKQVETTASGQARIDAAIKSNVSHFEWFMTANNTSPTFNADTKTLSWSSPLIAPSRNHTAGRIYIPAGSIVCDLVAVPNAVLYLDITKVPSNGTLTVEDIPNCLFYASYPTWRGEPNLIPLAKQDRTQNGGVALTACDGFVRIKNSFDKSDQVNLRGRYLEWQAVTAATIATFNPNTKVLSWNGFILAPFIDGTGNVKRIRLSALSVQLNANFDVVYIDLTQLNAASKDIVQADVGTVLKVGSYSTGFEHTANQIPIAKYDGNRNKVFPAAGFVSIVDTGAVDPTDKTSTDYFQYEKTATGLSVFLPTTIGKNIKLGLKKQVIPFDGTSLDSQSDLWRLFEAWKVNSITKENELMICNSGEWECALNVVGATDHVGGYHGDELQLNSIFYIDGVSESQDVIKSGEAKEIMFSQESIIYFQNTQTPLANHKKMLTFTKEGVLLKQKVTFLAEANLASAWLTMVPIMRTVGSDQITDKSSRSEDYFLQVDDNELEGFVRRYTPVVDGSKLKVWGETSKVALDVELVKTANWNSNQNVFITNGGGYNKIYVSAFNGAVTAGTVVPVGTTWEVETMFKLNIS